MPNDLMRSNMSSLAHIHLSLDVLVASMMALPVVIE